ncbi:MAG: alpha/beta hydrolase family protein [Phycisphaerae bacterium]
MRRFTASARVLTLPLWSLGLLMGFASMAGLPIGCAQSRGVAAACLIAEADWPARITDGLDQLAANLPSYPGPDQLTRSRADDPGQEAENEELRVPVVRGVVRGLGIVLELERVQSDEAARSPGETELAFVSFSPLARDGNRVERQKTRLPEKIGPSDLDARVYWRLYEPKGQRLRGLVVHLGGNKYVRRALLARGWAVLSSSGTGRFFQRRASRQTFEIERGEDIQEVAAQVAAVIDDELADWPYSLEAVLAYLAEYRPNLPQESLVVMGFSIGALGLPTVAARMPDRFQAAVIVAGGANLLEISQRSRKPDAGIELRWKGTEPTREDWQQLYAGYLQHAKLDPYHTAAALTGIPVLVCHAHFDQVVPAATGELLYARLGRPERFAFPVGHKQLLRIVMRLEARRIAEWTETALSRQPTPGEEDPAR